MGAALRARQLRRDGGPPQATCEIPSTGLDLVNIGAGGKFNWSMGNIGGYGAPWSETDTRLVAGQSYDIDGWTLAPTADGLRLRWDVTGHGMVVTPAGSATPFS